VQYPLTLIGLTLGTGAHADASESLGQRDMLRKASGTAHPLSLSRGPDRPARHAFIQGPVSLSRELKLS